MFKILLVSLSLLFFGSIYSQTARISGKITDATSNEAVPFATVKITNPLKGVDSDEAGEYNLTNLNPGLYNLEFSAFGYETVVKFEVEVTNAKTTFVNMALISADFGILDSVVITTNPFYKKQESPVSLRTLQASEIARFPGGNRDISKVIQALPGAAASVSFRNDVIIRGGAPNENRFYLDGIEVPNINHFATQGSSGGPVGLLNVNFIDKVDFYSGAFPANRGNAMSSVFEFVQKDGNLEKLETQFALGSSDVGLTFDGPVGEKTSFIFSARRSYLQFLFAALKLPFLPTYNDAQFKVKHKFNNKNELTVIGLGAVDEFELNEAANDGVTDSSTLEFNNYTLGNIPVNTQWNYTIGANYRHFKEKSYQTVVLSRNHLNNKAVKYQNNDDTSTDNLILDYSSQEIENKFRFENTVRINGWKLNMGVSFQNIEYSNRTYNKVFNSQGAQEIDFSSKLLFNRYGLFFQSSKRFFDKRLSLSAGLRTDFTEYSSTMSNPFNQLSPRFSLSYMITDQFGFNGNVGLYYQLPSYTVLGFRDISGQLVNKNNGISYIESGHAVAGLEYSTSKNAQITVEGFFKNYSNYPFLLTDSISLANLGADFGVIGNEPANNSSEGRSYGVELLIQQKLFKGLYGILAYTFVTSEFKDKNDSYLPSAWDSKHIVSVTGGKKFKRNWDVGFRWLFSGGSPYTPYDIEQSSNISAWSVRGVGLLDYNQLNARRLGNFHQLDIRVDKRWFFSKWSLNLYLDIQNFYNFQAEQIPILNMQSGADGALLTDPNDPSRYQPYLIENSSGNVLPSIGIIVEL
ncbi:MAG: TonB-dependent receptor [Crocinitomicaceae bacterium]|nr:TonB-dependent receptor [Crocinitomicaceae bacterium]